MGFVIQSEAKDLFNQIRISLYARNDKESKFLKTKKQWKQQ